MSWQVSGLVAALLVVPALAGPIADSWPLPGAARLAERQLVDVRVVADVEQVAPGETFHVVVLFDIADGWHLYWKNPGAGAARIEVEIESTPSAEVGDIRWPRPAVLGSPTGDMYVYEGHAGLFVSVVAPKGLTKGALRLTADIGWAVCDERQCHLRDAQLTIEVPIGAVSRPSNDPAISKARARLSRPIEEVDGASASFAGGQIEVELPAVGHTTATFLPNGAAGVTYGEPKFVFAPPSLRMRLPVEIDRNNLLDEVPVVGGLVVLGPDTSDPSFEFETPVRSLTLQSNGPTVHERFRSPK